MRWSDLDYGWITSSFVIYEILLKSIVFSLYACGVAESVEYLFTCERKEAIDSGILGKT